MPVSIIGANGEEQRNTLAVQLWLQRNLSDHFFGHHAVWKKFQMLKQVVTGGFGTRVKVPMKYPTGGGPENQGVQNPYTERSHLATEGITNSFWDIAEYMMLISAPERELDLEGNLTKRLDYLDSIMEINMDRHNDSLKTAFWAAPSGTYAAGNEWTLASIRALANKGGGSTTGPYSPAPLTEQTGSAVGSSVTSVGGIERNAAGNAYFCFPVYNPGSADTMGKSVANRLITRATKGNMRPDVLIVTMDHYDVLMGILQAHQAIQPSKLTDFGFTAFNWRGVDVIYDDDVPTAEPGVNAFALNTKAFRLLVKGLKPTVKKADPAAQAIEGWKVKFYIQLVMTTMGRGAGYRHANLNA